MTARFDRAFFFLLDGARVDLFADHLQRGDLPNIARYMVEPGAHRTAVSVFPSVTGVAYVPYLTGIFPGRANLPGYRWFDRERYHRRPLSMMRFRNYSGLGSYLMNRDLSKDATTLFEILRPSSNIFSGISRGTGFRRNAAYFRRIPAALKFFRTGSWDHIDEAGERFLLRAALRRRERFTFHTTYSIDEYSHHHGPFSERVRLRYLDFDRVIGRLIARLKTTGQLERSLLMMGADHGHTEVKAHFDLEGFIERRGGKTLYFPKKYRNWVGAKAAVMVAGNGMGHIYLKGPTTWNDRPTGNELLEHDPTLVDDLLASDAIDHVIFRPDDTGTIEVRPRREHPPRRQPGPLRRRSRQGRSVRLRPAAADDDARADPRLHGGHDVPGRAAAGRPGLRLAARGRLHHLRVARLGPARARGAHRHALVPRLLAPRAHDRAVRREPPHRPRAHAPLGGRLPDHPPAPRAPGPRRRRWQDPPVVKGTLRGFLRSPAKSLRGRRPLRLTRSS